MKRLRKMAELGSANNPHDYRNCYWGHDYVWRPENDGLTGHISGWGLGIEKGHYILIGKDGGTGSRYQFTSIRYCFDPKDMFNGKLKFAPRSPEQVESYETSAAMKEGK